MERKRRGVGCLVVMMLALAGIGLFGILAAGLSAGGGDSAAVIETVVRGVPATTKKIAIVPINGVMLGGPGAGTTGRVLSMLKHAIDDPQVVAVLLALDTPGGSVTDADLIHRKIGELRDSGRKVHSIMGDLCASGGVYAAVASEKIWAHPTTITGSIGVVIPNLNVSEFMARHGVADLSVMSGQNKAVLSPTRPQTPEQRALIQEVVDDLYERFVRLVAEGRKLEPAAVRVFADGRIFTAETAKTNGLVDQIGYEDEALSGLQDVSGGPINVVRYGRLPTLLELVGVKGPRPDAISTLERALSAPRAMYLYAPW